MMIDEHGVKAGRDASMTTGLRMGTLSGIGLRLAVALLAAHAPGIAHCQAGVDPARLWIEQTLARIVKYQQNPLRAARSLAAVAVALDLTAAREGVERGVAQMSQHAAAGAVLDHLYPQESPAKHRAMARFLAAQVAPPEQHDEAMRVAWRAGDEASTKVIARLLDDGADRSWNPALRPAPRPGLWRAAAPLNVYAPSEPLAGTWRTWGLPDVAQLAVSPPPTYDTPEYWREAREVWEVSRRLTPQQRQLADDWHLDKGSVTPAGVWNRHALQLLGASSGTAGQTARVLAAVNVAMYDALVAAWHVKYTYWTMRPVTAIRQRYDPAFLPYLITPPFPSYVSGHASVSGAAAEVLSHHFPERAEQLTAMAQAAADSRLYGGIHFRSDDEEGLRLGREVGRRVLALPNSTGEAARWTTQ
jgi:hypothetical protein